MTEEPAGSFHRKKTASHTNKQTSSRENAVRLRFNHNKISNSTAAEVGAVVVLELENGDDDDDHEVGTSSGFALVFVAGQVYEGSSVLMVSVFFAGVGFTRVCARD